jgi:glycosyltransferase involved in cell wall biosynthesis
MGQDKALKIALITPGGFDRAGRQRVIPALLALAGRLARRHQVTVIVLRQEPMPCRYPLVGADVINLGHVHAGLPGMVTLRRLRRLLTHVGRDRRPDVLHAFWIDECGSLAALVGSIWGVPVVVSVGGGELVWVPEIGYGGKGDWRSRVQSALALRLASAVTAGSRHARAPIAGHRHGVEVVPLGVDTASFQGLVERPDGPPWRLLHVANINEVKNQAMLLNALRLVLDRWPGTQLDLVGEDWLKGAVHRRVDEMGLNRAVHFHGLLDSEALAPFYRRAHLYLQASWEESQGVAVCEAAAAGVPTVGTAVGLVAELAPEAAWAVPCDDAGAMARAVHTLLADRERRQGLGRAAQAWARAHDADWTAETFEALYRRLAARSRS